MRNPRMGLRSFRMASIPCRLFALAVYIAGGGITVLSLIIHLLCWIVECDVRLLLHFLTDSSWMVAPSSFLFFLCSCFRSVSVFLSSLIAGSPGAFSNRLLHRKVRDLENFKNGPATNKNEAKISVIGAWRCHHFNALIWRELHQQAAR